MYPVRGTRLCKSSTIGRERPVELSRQELVIQDHETGE